MAKLNTKKEEDLTKKRIKQTIPLAHDIGRIISNAQLPMGELHASDNAKFDAVAKEILALMLEYNIKYVDKDFVFQLAFQPFDQIKQIVLTSLGHSFDRVLNNALEKEFRELTLKDMDTKLKLTT